VTCRNRSVSELIQSQEYKSNEKIPRLVREKARTGIGLSAGKDEISGFNIAMHDIVFVTIQNRLKNKTKQSRNEV
jgi:hypothetical protein